MAKKRQDLSTDFFINCYQKKKSNITLDDAGFETRKGEKIFVIKNVKTGSGAHPASSSLSSFQRLKRPDRDVQRSPPTSPGLKNESRYTSTPPPSFHGVDRDTFTFTNRQ